MAGITLSIEVDDKGTVKVKQFADETKKAFKEMEEGPKQARGSLDSLKDSWIGLTAKIGIATAAIYAAKRVTYDFALGIASAANDIKRQASILGINTDELQKWQYAAKMSDVNAQELSFGLKMLSRTMEDAATGTGDASKYFAAMGISVKDSVGNLRPLNNVMSDIADKFSQWEEGPRKIAIALQLFGRSGETIIPLLNQGKVGIEGFGKEAEKTGAIVRKDLLQAGSEAKDIFEGISIQWQSFKLSLGPAALEFAKFLEQIRPGAETIKTIFEEINRTIRDVKKAFEGLGIISPEIEVKRKILDIRGPKMGPPIIAVPETKGLTDIQKQIIAGEQDLAQTRIDAWAAVYSVQAEEDQNWIKLHEDALQKIIEGEQEFDKMREETWAAVYAVQATEDEEWVKNHEYALERIKEGDQEAAQIRIEAWEAYNQYLIDTEKNTSIIGETLAKNMASAWNFNIKNIISDSKSMGDAVKKVFLGMGDAFTSAISRMISDWMLFGNITGKPESGKGIIGWLSGLFGGSAAANIAMNAGVVSGGEFGWGGILQGFQHGADFWANKPMIIGVGEGGERERVTVTPESKMQGGKIPVEMGPAAGGGDTYIYFVNPIGFDEALMKNMGTILKGIAKDARMAGPMHSVIKGYG